MNQNSDNPVSTRDNRTFAQDVSIFIDHLESLASSLPKVLSTIEEAHSKARLSHKEFLTRHGNLITDERGSFFTIPTVYIRRNRILRKEVNQLTIAHKVIKRNYIVSLISQFDSFIGSLIKTMFY